MSKRVVNIILAMGLVIGAFAGTLVTGSADEHGNNQMNGSTELYVPWVPNGAMLDDLREEIDPSGPYYGSITVQNLEDETITVNYEVLSTGTVDQFQLENWETGTLTVDDLFSVDDEVDGSGVVLTTSNDARIAVVQKQASGSAPSDEARTSSEAGTVGGYTAMSEVSGSSVLPIVQTNNNWNTHIRVTNFGDQTANVEVILNPAGGEGDAPTFNMEIATGDTETLNLLGGENAIPDGWTGSALISADGPVGAIAERAKNETSMLIMNAALPVENSSTQYAPLVFQEWNYWNTGISIANLADVENEITITYYDRDGVELNTDSLTVPANGMDYVYTPASVVANDAMELDGFVGSAVITGEHPFRGAVDEVKYFGDDPDTGHAMSYMVEDQAATAGETLAMPIFQSGGEDGMGDTTGIQLFNPTDEWVAGAVRFITQFGLEYRQPLIVHLEPGEGYTVYPYEIPDFPADVHGSALVQVYAGDGAITAAANNVNYAVANDGSASFNLMLTGEAGPETPEYILRTDPRRATNEWFTTFSLTATLMDVDGNPVPNEEVLIMVNPSIEGPPGDARILTTNEDGQVVFNDEFTRGGSELVDRFIIIYPGFDPGEQWPEDPWIETYAWKTWVAPGPEPDASIQVELRDDAGNVLSEGDTVTSGSQLTAEATVIKDGEPLANQEVNFNWFTTTGPGWPDLVGSDTGVTGADGTVTHTQTVSPPNIDVCVDTVIEGWPFDDCAGIVEVE